MLNDEDCAGFKALARLLGSAYDDDAVRQGPLVTLRPVLERLDGVAAVKVLGGLESEVRVEIDEGPEVESREEDVGRRARNGR